MKLPIQSIPVARSNDFVLRHISLKTGINVSEHYEGHNGAGCTNQVGENQATRHAACAPPNVTHYVHETHPHRFGLFGKKSVKRTCNPCLTGQQMLNIVNPF